MADEAQALSRLEREVAYYRREVNDLGAKLLRSQEEQQRFFLDAQRSRLVAKMVRELHGATSRGGPRASLPELVLEVVAENAMCASAALLAERELGGGTFAPVATIGLSLAEHRQPLRLRRTPPFAYTTGVESPEPSASEIAAFLGTPYILWAYDAASGYALALGNRNEANASRPFGLADQELIETALTIFLDARSRTASLDGFDEESTDSADDDGRGERGLEGGDVLRQQLRRGGRILGVLVVERAGSEGWECVPYLRVSWKRGWHVLRGYRNRTDRTYRHLNPLLQMARSDFGFTGPIVVYTLDSPELESVPGVAARERGEQRLITDSHSRPMARPDAGT